MARDRKDKSTISFFERMDLGEKLVPDWNIPHEFPDLTKYPQIAIDLETKLGTSRSATRTVTTWTPR